MAESGKISAFFSHLVSLLGAKRDISCIVVAHMVPNAVHFIPAVADLTNLAAVFAKPKTVHRDEYRELSSKFRCEELSREWARNSAAVISKLYDLGLRGKRVVILDIGGYFADSIDEIAKEFQGEIAGVIEGTENGVRKYLLSRPSRAKIATVARSPLKLPEDYLVASSIIFSVEATLREQAEILQTRSGAVLGYGRVGSAVAEILRGRGINTVVYDKDPIKLAMAAARGFQANIKLADALSAASLVVCATGNIALDLIGFGLLRRGCVVASVTSADDEFDLPSLDVGYLKSELSTNITKYEEMRQGGRHFYLVAGGNAANFLHGAVIGPAIQLIEAEKLTVVADLLDGKLQQSDYGLMELSLDSRTLVADVWNEHFL
jgi:adenosylhomocysteinase